MDKEQIRLNGSRTYYMPIKNGRLEINVSLDGEYPGIDIEYVSDMEQDVPDSELKTRPRVLVECSSGELSTAIWANPDKEDYTEKIRFRCIDDEVREEYAFMQPGRLLCTENGRLFHAGGIYTDGKDTYIKDADHGGSYAVEEINRLKSSDRTEDQFRLQEKFRKYGMNLVWNQKVENGKDHVFFYGGEICTVYSQNNDIFPGTEQAVLTLAAKGDVIGNFYHNGHIIDSFKDTRNQGYRHGVDRYLHDNAKLERAMAQDEDEIHKTGYSLLLQNNNWLELFCGVTTAWSRQHNVSTAVHTDETDGAVLETDHILTEMDDVFHFLYKCRRILKLKEQVFAVEIEWDADEAEKTKLPAIIPIPEDIVGEAGSMAITDYLSRQTGFPVAKYATITA